MRRRSRPIIVLAFALITFGGSRYAFGPHRGSCGGHCMHARQASALENERTTAWPESSGTRE